MFPIGDDNTGRVLTPVVNYALIALNLLVFLYELTLNDLQLTRFVYRYGAIPHQVAHGHDLSTLVTCMFLHGGWLHVGGNMLFLWVFGDNVEDIMGHVKYLIFYFLVGIAAGLAEVFVDTTSRTPLIGASGAIAGVLGAYILLFPRGQVRTLVLIGIFATVIMIPAWVQIGLWIILQFLNGFATLGVHTRDTGGVAYFAHIGGFLAGALLVWLFRNPDAHRRQQAARQGSRAWQRMGLFNRG